MKTVLITGASKGIGLETCLRLSKNKYVVLGIARSQPEEFPGQFFCCDLSKKESTADVLKTIAQSYQVDAIVNCVNVPRTQQSLGSIDLQSLELDYELNVRSALQVTQQFVENMKKRKWGRIVNIVSRTIFGLQGHTSQSAAKSALVGCTRTWALELARFGITANAIAPGPIATEDFLKKRPPGSQEEKAITDTIPLGRLGKPEEIAGVIAFLLSEDAAYITGQTICVDGGVTL